MPENVENNGKSTRQRLIEAAFGLFYRHGFYAVGLDRILAEVGVTKTTFYNHFESKEDLGLAVVRHQDEWFQQFFREKLAGRAANHPAAQLDAVFDVVDAIVNDESYMGCFFINAAVEFPSPHDPVHQAAAESKLATEDVLRDLAAKAGARDPALLAKGLLLLMEGAYVTSQITQDKRITDVARHIAQVLIDNQLPQPEADASESESGR